jgi:tripartite-type tricarboxylate transporter receptor subunit TctC
LFFPSVIISRPDTKSMRELLDTARAKPGSVSFGSAGIGSTQHLTGELLAGMAGVKFLHVPYGGGSAATTGLLRGDTHFVITTATEAMGHIRAGKLRGLALTGPVRWQGLPDVPTVAESGVAGFDVRSWMGLATTAGTPPAIIERLNAEMQRTLQAQEVRKRLEEIGGDVRGSTPADMRTRVATELKNWVQVIKQAGIERQ